MNKKALIIFLIVLVILAGLIWFVFFRQKPVVVQPTPEKPITEQPARLPVTRSQWEVMTIEERGRQGLPLSEWPAEGVVTETPVAPEKITPEIDEVASGGRTWINTISDDVVQNATLAGDGQSNIYYDKTGGHFYKIDNLGNKELLTDQIFYNVDNINWAPTKDRAILEYPDGFKVMYDFDQKKQYTLPKNWENFSWDSSGSHFAFESTSQYSENNWLATSRADGSEAKPIEHIGENADKVTVSWSPNNQVVAFSATGDPRGAWEQEILLIGQNGENFKSLVIDGRGFESKWSPIGDKIVYSVYSADSNYQPKLYLVNAQGEEIGSDKIDLKLATWADKCAFNNNGSALYCAVPKNLPEGSGLITDLAANTRDDFYKIDAVTGQVSFLAEGAMGGYNVGDIYLSSDESTLYFVDKDTSHLRSIKLK